MRITKDFSQCFILALKGVRKLKREGVKAEAKYGLYTPTTLENTWDHRWQGSTTGVFIHAWVETSKGLLIDYACEQFGVPAPYISGKEDSRYEVLGRIDPKNGNLISTSLTKIEWDSRHLIDNRPAIRVIYHN